VSSAIVTGGGAGIGAEIARRAAANGLRVGVLDHTAEKAEQVASTLPDAVALHADVTDEAEVERALDTFGEVPDLMVCNAGIVRFGPLVDASLDDWRAVVEVNLTGVFVTARAAARRMIPRGSGSIVILSSINGIVAGPNSGAYGAAKAGVALLAQQMAVEWGPLGIRVNAVAPGFIDGGMSRPVYDDRAAREGRTSKVPLRRLGTEADVAHVVLFLASTEASYISGQNIVVDGALTASLLAHMPRPESVDRPQR
jgi:NAD(P)-dependent dehydrogenase (short-subunit alcohol dehydrogenase family)